MDNSLRNQALEILEPGFTEWLISKNLFLFSIKDLQERTIRVKPPVFAECFLPSGLKYEDVEKVTIEKVPGTDSSIEYFFHTKNPLSQEEILSWEIDISVEMFKLVLA